jgi:hypothetical protein
MRDAHSYAVYDCPMIRRDSKGNPRWLEYPGQIDGCDLMRFGVGDATHDDQCEADFLYEAGSYTPCLCDQRTQSGRPQ